MPIIPATISWDRVSRVMLGGKVVLDDNFNKLSTIMIQKDNKETWIEVRSFGNMYRSVYVLNY